MVRRLATLFLAVLLGLAPCAEAFGGFGGSPTGILPATKTATVTANLASTSSTIPADFCGFSFELADVISDNIYTGSNTTLIGLLQLLGPNGMIRVGGGSQDSSPSAPALTQNIANDLFSFTNGIGSSWHLSYGLDLFVNNSTTAVTQAGYIINAFGSRAIFELGNEPDIGPYSPATAANYASLWNPYYTALTGAYTGLQFVGPSVTTSTNLQSFTNVLSLASTAFRSLTFHFYPFSGIPPITANQLLASVPTSLFTANTSYATTNNLRLNETGPVYATAGYGIGDRLVQATWFLEEATSLAALNYQGINSHTVFTTQFFGAASAYNAFVKDGNNKWVPQPTFYGQYLFSKMAGNAIVSTTNANLDAAASVLAVKQNNGKAAILVTNGNVTTNISVQPDQSAAWSTANLYLLSGTSCYDPAPVLNGFAIGEGGTWPGSVQTIAYGTAITIPPCGAALVQIQ